MIIYQKALFVHALFVSNQVKCLEIFRSSLSDRL